MSCKGGILSPDGLCKTFDESANGYVRGEGVGVVVLKRLQDALESGDHVLGVIKGSASNHGGASSGYSVPNGRAQEALYKQALNQARLTSDSSRCIGGPWHWDLFR